MSDGLNDPWKGAPSESILLLGRRSLHRVTCPAALIEAESYLIRAVNAPARAEGLFEAGTTCYGSARRRTAPCTKSGVFCPIAEAQRTRAPVQVRHEHLDVRGQLRLQNVLALPLASAAGRVTQVLLCCWDVPNTRPEPEPRDGSSLGHDLTRRERQVLVPLIEGLKNAAIAERLCVTVPTVKYHVRNIKKKLGASSRTQACMLALLHGLVRYGLEDHWPGSKD
jgi:DNA-binding CsgD family transcriptional regulator